VYFSMGQRHDYRGPLRQVRVPVLIVHGEDDVLPKRVSRMYASAFPNARLRIIKDTPTRGAGRAGHFLWNDLAEEFAKVVGEFLASLEQHPQELADLRRGFLD
jgi:pimeloyl-ACP methyl ester carboxylesterase